MRLATVTLVIWAAVALVWWFTVGAEVAKATPNAKKTPTPTWEAIAGFYAGRPIAFNWQADRVAGANTTQDGRVNMPANFKDKLADLVKAMQGHDKQAKLRASVLDIDALSVLLHEAIHNRSFGGMSPMGEAMTPTGFKQAGNEPQAQALGAELVPDLLQRFFGVKIGSPMSKRFAHNAKTRGEYDAAYRMNGLPPPSHG